LRKNDHAVVNRDCGTRALLIGADLDANRTLHASEFAGQEATSRSKAFENPLAISVTDLLSYEDRGSFDIRT
jgi:hypothetical protein